MPPPPVFSSLILDKVETVCCERPLNFSFFRKNQRLLEDWFVLAIRGMAAVAEFAELFSVVGAFEIGIQI